jgi:hypothetical protein
MIKVSITYKDNHAAALQAIRSAAQGAISESARDILERAKAIVPLDETPLQNSGAVAVIGDETFVSFGTGESAAYAVIQHENLQYAHAPGRQAKYLEQPFREQRDAIIRRVADRIKCVL